VFPFGSEIGNELISDEGDRSRHVIPKGQARDPNTLEPNISKTTGDATICYSH